jgi:hypothetical protein
MRVFRGGVTPVNAAATPTLSQQGADLELRRLRSDGDRIAAALVELDDHPGRRFLEGTGLAGSTLALWTAAQAAITTLWDRFTRYREVLDRAGHTTDLVALTELLCGRSVELPVEQVPLEQRVLTAAATVVPRVTLGELVTTMTADHREAAAVVMAAERVWSAYVPWLDRWTSGSERRWRPVSVALSCPGSATNWLPCAGWSSPTRCLCPRTTPGFRY